MPTKAMDANEWINGYLEAILDTGAVIAKHRSHGVFAAERSSEIEHRRPQAALRNAGNFNPTKFFVEEVISSYDETDIHRTWMKTIAMRNAQERNNRLENMCWRIWHLTRKKKQIEWEDAQKLARRHFEREQGHRDATKELSEFSDGEKSDQSQKPKKSVSKLSRNFSDFEMFIQQQPQKKKCLYIVLIRYH